MSRDSRGATRLGRTVLVWNLALLGVAGVVGLVAYRGRLVAFGDAMNMFRPSATDFPSAFGFVRYWYTVANGRIGGFFVDAVFQRLSAYFPFSPTSYPWWLLCALSLFAAAAAPANLAAGIEVAGRRRWRAAGPLAATVAVLALVWTSSPVVFETTLLGQAIGEYFAAFYFFSLGWFCLWLSREVESQALFVAAAVLYLQASLSYEQILTAAPVVFSAASVLTWAGRSDRRRRLLGEIGLWLGLTVLAFAVMNLSPGQRQRAAVVMAQGVSFAGRVPYWLAYSTDQSYALVLGAWPGVAALARWWHAAAILTSAVIAVRALGQQGIRAFDSEKVRLAGLALAFLLAMTSSTAHLIISDYAPARAFVFPGLLLLVGWTCLVRSILSGRGPAGLGRAVAVVALFAGVLTAWPNLGESRSMYRRSVWHSALRVDAYERVIQRHRESGATQFQLSRCPLDLDAPWGTAAFFAWSQLPQLVVTVEGQNALERGLVPVVECDVPPLFDGRTFEPGAPMAPVRSFGYLTGEHRGVTAYDYWVPDTMDACDVLVAANPNVAGSSSYRDTASLLVLFTNTWDSLASKVARVMVVKEVALAASGGLKVNASLAYRGQEASVAHLDGWAHDLVGRPEPRVDSPLLRISIEHGAPGNLGAYDRVSVQCR